MAQKVKSTKEQLLDKLMPALQDNPYAEADEILEKEEITEETLEELQATPAPQPGPLALLHSQIFGRDASYELTRYCTINVMEVIVMRHVDNVMHRFNCCSCDRCRCDVVALALNELTPRYLVAPAKKLEEAADEIEAREIIGTLINVVVQVRQNPRH